MKNFAKNLNNGISYYNDLFSGIKDKFNDKKQIILDDLRANKKLLYRLNYEIKKMTEPVEQVKS